MDNELLMRDLKALDSALSFIVDDGINYQRWFISFGSLLYVIRDKNLGLEFNQDIDISIVGPHNYDKIKGRLEEDGFQLVSHIKNDITGEVLFADFKSPNGLSVDLFFWINHNGYLWHTYDYMAERPENGIPNRYHFKALPQWMMTGEPYKYDWFQEMSPLKIPNKYGTLLDYWYPHWYIPDNEFGVSRTDIIREPTTCKDLPGVLTLGGK